MKLKNNSTFGSQSHNEGKEKVKKRGILLAFFFVAFGLSFFSCEGQNPKPIKVDVTTKPNNNGVGFGVKKDTVFINVPFEVIKEVEVIKEIIKEVPVPYEVIKTVEVIKEVKVPEPYPVEVIKEVPVEVIKEVEKIVYQDKIVEVIKEKGPAIDTLQTISDIILLDFTDSAVQPTNKAAVYAMISGIGLAEIKMDTMYAWQRAYNLKRTQEYGKVSYESFGLPFQVRSVECAPAETTIKVTTNFTEQCHVAVYLNNKLVPAISDTASSPYSATKKSEIEYRHGRTITGLVPGTEYEISTQGTTPDGRKAFSEIVKIKTLP